MPPKKKLCLISTKKLLQLKPYLDELVDEIEQPDYIESDPIQFMHAFEDKADRETAGFFAAIMAWGRRDIVNAKVEDLIRRMNYKPAQFIGNFSESDAHYLEGFKHRTFKDIDIYWMVRILQSLLLKYGKFEDFWTACYQIAKTEERELMAVFHEQFFSLQKESPQRTRKHISNPEKNSSAKRLYMYLRWCIRKNSDVDLGIMNFMPASELKIPLDVHVARQARKLGLLSRHQNDWKSVVELTEKLSLLEPDDPAKYDFALFGIGVLKHTIPENFIINKGI